MIKTVKITLGEDIIIGDLYFPDKAGHSKVPAVIASHGWLSNRRAGKWPILGERFSEKGMVFFVIDHRCARGGESSGKLEDMTFTMGVEDLIKSFEYIQGVNGIDHNQLIFLGSSLGGMRVLVAYLKISPVLRDRIKAIVLLATPCFLPLSDRIRREIETKGYVELSNGERIKRDFFDDISMYNIMDAAKNILCPVCIIHGEKDEDVSVEHAESLYKSLASSSKELHIIKGASHSFSEPGKLNEICNIIFDFLERNIHMQS